ncbi:hypothetical protein GCM10022421_28180 [Oceanisphaera sediminis]|uniref:Transposase DDE domain-containing protein n=1 Tax=Oceanisphaera sediminis TaxID=981381 RepID=A0ABP7EGY2_9GAMM
MLFSGTRSMVGLPVMVMAQLTLKWFQLKRMDAVLIFRWRRVFSTPLGFRLERALLWLLKIDLNHTIKCLEM